MEAVVPIIGADGSPHAAAYLAPLPRALTLNRYLVSQLSASTVYIVVVALVVPTVVQSSAGPPRYSTRYMSVSDTAFQLSDTALTLEDVALRPPGAGGPQYGRLCEARSLVATLSRATGMQPVRLLPDSLMVCRLHSLPSSAGISPVSSLSDRSSVTRADSPPSAGEIVPSRSSSSSSNSITLVELAFSVMVHAPHSLAHKRLLCLAKERTRPSPIL